MSTTDNDTPAVIEYEVYVEGVLQPFTFEGIWGEGAMRGFVLTYLLRNGFNGSPTDVELVAMT